MAMQKKMCYVVWKQVLTLNPHAIAESAMVGRIKEFLFLLATHTQIKKSINDISFRVTSDFQLLLQQDQTQLYSGKSRLSKNGDSTAFYSLLPDGFFQHNF